MLLPLVSPPFTTAIAMIFSFGPRGLITYELLGLKGVTVYGLTSTAFSEVLTYFPIAYLTLRPILAGIDSNIEGMALSLGASRSRVFRTVTLPLSVPGLANAFLLLFAASLADFATPLILAGNQFPVLPTQAYLQITGLYDLRGGAALSFVLLVPALARVRAAALLGLAPLLRDDHRQGRRPDAVRQRLARGARGARRRVPRHRARDRLFLRAAALRVACRRAGREPRVHACPLPRDLHRRAEGDPRHADHRRLRDAAGRPLRDPRGLPRCEEGLRRAADDGADLDDQLRTSGTIVGIAYLVAFNDPPIELTGTALIIVACYVFRYGPTGIRATVALLQQIDKSLEEASQGLGAGSGTTFRRITLPLIVPAFFAGLGIVFIRSMTAISATIFLVSVGWTLITVKILENITELSLGPAAAFSVLVVRRRVRRDRGDREASCARSAPPA